MPQTQETSSSNRFYVQIDNVIQAVFWEVSGLQIETEVTEYREGGNNGFVHRLPGATRVGNITLKQGLVASSKLFDWYTDITMGKIDRRNMSIVVYTAAGEETSRWSFINAYPIRWIGPTLSGDSSTAMVETLELAHEGLELVARS
jgi:phage tail-like protein